MPTIIRIPRSWTRQCSGSRSWTRQCSDVFALRALAAFVSSRLEFGVGVCRNCASLVSAFGLLLVACSLSVAQEAEDGKPVKEPAVKEGWLPLTSPASLGDWEPTNFGGEGEVKMEDEMLQFEMGDPLTGVTWKGKEFPKTNFEIKLEARRVKGNDFLCGLTFPVGDSHASLIGGGWGGGVVGLSSVDGNDASENSTSSYRDFQNNKWYSFRVRVDDEHVTAWVDDERVFKQERKGHDFSVRAEVMANRPLGFCVFQSKVQVRKFEWRPLDKATTGKSISEKQPAK